MNLFSPKKSLETLQSNQASPHSKKRSSWKTVLFIFLGVFLVLLAYMKFTMPSSDEISQWIINTQPEMYAQLQAVHPEDDILPGNVKILPDSVDPIDFKEYEDASNYGRPKFAVGLKIPAKQLLEKSNWTEDQASFALAKLKIVYKTRPKLKPADKPTSRSFTGTGWFLVNIKNKKAQPVFLIPAKPK